MRVLHVIPAIAPRYGGPSTVLRPMVQALNRLPGVRAEVATTDADGVGRCIGPELPNTFQTPVHLFHRTFSERWKYSHGLWRWLNAHVRDFDIVHVHALWTFATTAACSAARRNNVPVVLRPCGMLSSYTLDRFALRKRIYYWLTEGKNLETARRFHVTSAWEKNEVERLGLRGNAPAVVIPHGLEPEAWDTPINHDELRKRCARIAGNRPIILFLSRLHPKKGINDQLLPAFARLRSDAILAIAGAADDHTPGYEQEVRATIASLKLGDRVELLGSVTARERWAILDGASLFVLPSHSENFGVVVIEAMARAIPVVVSSEVHASEHVEAAVAGSVVPLDVDALAHAMDHWLESPQESRQAGAFGKDYTRQHLQWDSVAAKLQTLYGDCLA